MRRLLSIIIFIFWSIITFAQDIGNPLYSQGYSGNIEMNFGFNLNYGFNGALLTSHGYKTGFGMYVGAGTGLIVSTEHYTRFSMPIFADVKYNFIDKPFSPFLNMKLGTEMNLEEFSAGLYCSPSIGVDFRRFSVFLKYDFSNGKVSLYSDMKYMDYEYSKNVFSVGVSYAF